MGMRGEVKEAVGLQTNEGMEELTWEKLLKRSPVSVLLIEQDDSTSQIITALLRKCGYRVTVASDGLKAWMILTEKDHNIDLVLSEVELPKMSGVYLLAMMMAHEKCKHIPVIMMSSNDSISIAFKCMIKGASDFLVKPIRKNELINLWQHVWRKQKSENHAIQKRNLEIDYDYHSIDNATYKQDDKDCSEKESDAQSSCTRSDMEVESTCTLQSKMELKQEQHRGVSLFDETLSPDKHFVKQMDGISLFPNDKAIGSISIGGDIQPEVFDPIAVVNYQQQRTSICDYSSDESMNRLLFDTDLENKTCIPSLQPSLKRYPFMSSSKESDVSNTLHHSNFSAFSLYNNRSKVTPPSSKLFEFQSQNKGSCSSCIEPVAPFQFAAKPLHYDHGLPINADDTDHVDSSTLSRQEGTTFRCTPIRFIPFPVPVGGISFNATESNPFLQQPTFYPLQSQSPWNSGQQTFFENISYQSGIINDFKDYSLESQNIQNHHHLGQVEEDAELVDKHRPVSPTNGDNAGICNISRDHPNRSWSTDISNESNDRPVSNTIDISEPGAISGGHDGFQQAGLIKSADSTYRLSQREAALNKFRLKRKERCFEKKVRYLSRKKLAEQRPRVKGQFVRQL